MHLHMYRYRHTRLKLVPVLSRSHLSSMARHIESSRSYVRVLMQLAACANGVRMGCLAGSPRSCGAVRARQSSAASWSCIVVLAHTGNLACPLLPSALTDGRATVQNLPQLAYEGTEHGGQWGEGRGEDLHAAPRRQLRARWEGFEAAAHLDYSRSAWDPGRRSSCGHSRQLPARQPRR